MKLDQPTLVNMPASVSTHCPYCALQCGMTLRRPTHEVTEEPRVSEAPAVGPRVGEVTVEPRAVGSNAGGLCQKGWTSTALLSSPERLTTPLVRNPEGELRPASWQTAMRLVASVIRNLQARHGSDTMAVLGGGGLTNEKAYSLGKFARVVLRTKNIDYNGRFCMSSAAAAGMRAFGIDRGLPFPQGDIADADTVMLVGANVAETMPPFLQYLTTMRERSGSLIVVDPRLTPTARDATVHLQITPGTDLALALGLLHIAITDGYVDADYIANRTTGFEAVRRIALTYWPDRVERITGVPIASMRETVRLLGSASRAIILTARGAEQHAKGVDTVSAFVNLALALGLPGTPGSGYGCLTGQGNGQGGREHGQKADQLPGYRRLDDPAARKHVASVWGVSPGDLPGPGPSAFELLDSLGTPDGPRGLLVFGTNPVVSAPAAAHITNRIRDLDFLVVSDLFLSETAELADVVLPSAQWAEEDGTMTTMEGRVVRRRRLGPPPSDVRTDLEILAGLASALGLPGAIGTDPSQVFEELGRASAGGPADYSGISYARLGDSDGIFWPCPSPSHDGTPRMFLDRFGLPDGRARFVAVEHRAPVEDIDGDYPVYLTTGRVLAHYQSGAQTRRVAALRKAVADPFVEIHPDLAARHGITNGLSVRITSRRGSIVAPARVTDTIRTDTVFMPFHWSGIGRANTLTNPALDPVSRMPEFKVCAVRLEVA